MPTSVHIPLLAAVDKKAKALKISRNRLILRALEREVTEGEARSPEFFARLEAPEPAIGEAVRDGRLRSRRSHG